MCIGWMDFLGVRQESILIVNLPGVLIAVQAL